MGIRSFFLGKMKNKDTKNAPDLRKKKYEDSSDEESDDGSMCSDESDHEMREIIDKINAIFDICTRLEKMYIKREKKDT